MALNTTVGSSGLMIRPCIAVEPIETKSPLEMDHQMVSDAGEHTGAGTLRHKAFRDEKPRVAFCRSSPSPISPVAQVCAPVPLVRCDAWGRLRLPSGPVLVPNVLHFNSAVRRGNRAP